LDHVNEGFDMEAIRNADFNIGYDAMYGAGKSIVKTLLPDASCLHMDDNPGFEGRAPEPIMRNLGELSELIKKDDSIQVGFANDGDADRIGLFDEDGAFVDSHHILLLLLLYTHKYKKQTGKVVVTFSVTDKMRKLCEAFGLDITVTKIGFKYIAEIMTKEDVLVGGEESGGLAVKGHVPERDGVWIALMIFEFMAKTGKSLKELVQEVYDLVGTFATDRDDLHLDNDKKWAIIDNCKNGVYKSFGKYNVEKVEDVDGHKFYFGDEKWIMMRPSGTEPVLRVYAHGADAKETRAFLDATQADLN